MPAPGSTQAAQAVVAIQIDGEEHRVTFAPPAARHAAAGLLAREFAEARQQRLNHRLGRRPQMRTATQSPTTGTPRAPAS